MNFLWLFFTTSFIGWILETVTAAFQQKKFLNRGAVNAPFCVLYGSASLIERLAKIYPNMIQVD